jgi:hypothetical protein
MLRAAQRIGQLSQYLRKRRELGRNFFPWEEVKIRATEVRRNLDQGCHIGFRVCHEGGDSPTLPLLQAP